MEALRILLFIVLLSVAFAAKCNPTTLPNAPVFPTSDDFISSSLVPSVTSSNPLTTKHWSETARLSLYRPPSASIVADPPRDACPHLGANLLNWHDASTWPGGKIPANGNDVTIPAGAPVLVSHCSGTSTNVFGTINVPAGSSLIFDDATFQFNARSINVTGSLLLGSDTCRLRNKITITLHGSRAEYANILPGPHWTKGIAVSGTIDVHGVQYFPTWTRLAMTAKPGDSWIFIQDVVNWQIGQTIVITTTELKDARDFNRNEERTILAVKRVQMDNSISAVQLSSPLTYQHFAGREYQAEVSLLSRNIVIQGDEAGSPPTDTQNVACKSPNDASTAPCENSFLTGFGAHVMVHGPNAAGRFSGVEMFRVGQTNVLGHYPIHYHLIGDITSSQYTRAYVRDSSVHESYFRCYAIHGTSGVKLTENTAYNAIGHCYFLEDGVEENNIISYNQAAYVHPLGPYQFSKLNGNDGFWGQNLDWYPETPNLILPSDMSAGCFYITNAYNDIIGNAASGGWAGFAAPSLKLPVKLHKQITNMKPAGRPFRVPFAGNSAHSSGYWFNSAGPFYIGGELRHRADGLLEYTAGRSMSHDTCKDKTAGTPAGDGGCWAVDNWLSLDFNDNKVFLGNRGMQNWGDRSNIVRMEMHDVGLSMNVFGTVWIDKLLMECRTSTNRITFFSGCTGAPKEGSTSWGSCNARDYVFFNQFGGFQWYDVGQQHILTDSTFRNCREDWNRCTQGSKPGVCNGVAVFASLTHSDQFVPELMQVTSGIKYENVSDLWKYTTQLTDSTGVTVSGRLQSWYDADGSASQVGSRAMIGSAWANRWWRYNDDCTYYREAYRCPLKPGDSAASVIMKLNNADEGQIGNSLCVNGHYGSVKYTCPVIGRLTHFGNNNETDGLSIAVNGKLSGPLIASSGGWFMRYNAGTPKKLTFTSVQVKMEDIFLVAIPYPAGTTFTVYHQAATWCGTSWAHCRHDYIQVNSIAAVKSHFGDAYYFDTNARTLYLRLVQPADTFGPPSSDNTKRWTPVQPAVRFSAGGQELITPNYQTYIIIEASCSSDPCAPQNDVRVPAAMPITVVTSSSGVIATTAGSTASVSTSTSTTAKPSSTSTSTTAAAAASTAAASSSTGTKPSTTASSSAAAASSTGAKPSTASASASSTAAAAASSTGAKPSTTASAASSSTGAKPSTTSSASSSTTARPSTSAASSSTGAKPSTTSSASSATTARPSTSAASSSTTRTSSSTTKTSSSSSTTRTSSSSSTSSVSTPRPTTRPVKYNVQVALEMKGNYSQVNTSKIAAAFAKTFDLDVSQVSIERVSLVPTNSTKTRSTYANDDTYTITITIKDVNETIAKDKVFSDVYVLVEVLSNSPSFIEALVESGSSITDAKTDVGVAPTEPISTNTGDFINMGSSLHCSLVSAFSLLLLSVLL